MRKSRSGQRRHLFYKTVKEKTANDVRVVYINTSARTRNRYFNQGGTIYLKPGTYTLDKPIVLKGGTNIIGSGWSRTFIKPGPNYQYNYLIYSNVQSASAPWVGHIAIDYTPSPSLSPEDALASWEESLDNETGI